MTSLALMISCMILLTCATGLSEGQLCRKCPQYWMEVGEHCFRYFGQRVKWHDANTICKQIGGHLPSIHNKEEESTIYQLWKGLVYHPTQKDSAYWLGLRDTDTEGVYIWTDNTETDYTNWYPGQPNNLNGEDCVEVCNYGLNDDERMEWNDLGCEQTRSFFCRKLLY